MKFYADNECILELSDIQLKVLANEISIDELKADLKRRAAWVIQHKYERMFERFKKHWEGKLAALGHESLPTNKEAFAELVFACPEYKCRKKRDEAGEKHQQVWDNQTDGERPR